MTDEGIANIKLRPYQEEMLSAFQNNRYVIMMAARQIGKTITSSIFLAWYACFHFDRNVLVIANKMATTVEIVDKIKKYPAKRIRITGGEPMLQDLSELMKELYFKCNHVAIETNGTRYDNEVFESADLISVDVKGPSSGEESNYKIIQKLYHRFKDKTEFKFVISNLGDLVFYKEYREKIEGADIVLMCDSRIDPKAKTEIIDEILKSCPEARYCIRLQCELGLK